MPERRILETTRAPGRLPPDTLEVLRQQATMRTVPATRCSSNRTTPPASCSASSAGASRSLTRSPDGRESMVAVLERGRAVRRARPVRRRPAFGRRACAHDRAARRARATTTCAPCSRRTRAPLGHRARSSPDASAAPTRRSPTRCSSTCPPAPRSDCSSSPAATTSSAPDDPGGSRRARRRVARAGEQGARAVHAPRLDRGQRPQPLPHPRPRSARAREP